MPDTASKAFKPPTQARSRASVERVYKAVNALLQEKHFDQITMQELSRRSKVAVGSIYQRFGSKDELLWVLYGTYLEDASARSKALAQASAALTLEDRVRARVGLTFDLFTQHTGIIRSLLLKYRQTPDVIPRPYRDQIESALDNAVRVLLADDNPAIDRTRAEYAVSLIIAMCRELILFRDYQWASPPDLDKDEFVEHVTGATLAILKG